MTKEQILAKLRVLAEEHGGHISFQAFRAETGLSEHKIIGKYWTKWNDALAEAGLATKEFFNPRMDENDVIEAFARLIERLGKWPTKSELEFEHNNNDLFPSEGVFRRLKKKKSLAVTILEYCNTHEALPIAASIARERVKSEKPDSPHCRSPINGYVYMMKSGRRYKIGKTNSPSRRHREVRLDLPDPTHLVHTIETDDPTGIEAYWHKRFDSKRVRDTEFFELDASDVGAFKRRKYQ